MITSTSYTLFNKKSIKTQYGNCFLLNMHNALVSLLMYQYNDQKPIDIVGKCDKMKAVEQRRVLEIHPAEIGRVSS